ncbi:hypothetical protein BDK51DRAFT_27917 [Blyttiomyces helicus]|uniref:Uncharacterized protein n=1 Tax=Blyttiomyces helicus TaxID=388810 RepID=A0A4P9WB27_9FUNG|nr:hypothetical protein BDK51DRAFT_27917 [Blyttiomyces helicus]|eukprot:RKO87466.1 hypothetical protein BDK51DRAFT_27917 [Blyttiomyces helicus]
MGGLCELVKLTSKPQAWVVEGGRDMFGFRKLLLGGGDRKEGADGGGDWQEDADAGQTKAFKGLVGANRGGCWVEDPGRGARWVEDAHRGGGARNPKSLTNTWNVSTGITLHENLCSSRSSRCLVAPPVGIAEADQVRIDALGVTQSQAVGAFQVGDPLACDTKDTACTISGLVGTMAYIKEPITLRYSTFLASEIEFSGASLFWLIASTVAAGEQDDMLKRTRIQQPPRPSNYEIVNVDGHKYRPSWVQIKRKNKLSAGCPGGGCMKRGLKVNVEQYQIEGGGNQDERLNGGKLTTEQGVTPEADRIERAESRRVRLSRFAHQFYWHQCGTTDNMVVRGMAHSHHRVSILVGEEHWVHTFGEMVHEADEVPIVCFSDINVHQTDIADRYATHLPWDPEEPRGDAIDGMWSNFDAAEGSWEMRGAVPAIGKERPSPTRVEGDDIQSFFLLNRFRDDVTVEVA